MSIESQLERICIALEALAKMHAGPLFNKAEATGAAGRTSPATEAKKEEVKTETKKAEPKAEVKKEEPKSEPENTDKASFDDLADKVKALGRTNRDAVVALFKQFGIERLGGLEEKDYIAFDIAIAKAINAAKGD